MLPSRAWRFMASKHTIGNRATSTSNRPSEICYKTFFVAFYERGFGGRNRCNWSKKEGEAQQLRRLTGFFFGRFCLDRGTALEAFKRNLDLDQTARRIENRNWKFLSEKIYCFAFGKRSSKIQLSASTLWELFAAKNLNFSSSAPSSESILPETSSSCFAVKTSKEILMAQR